MAAELTINKVINTNNINSKEDGAAKDTIKPNSKETTTVKDT